MLEPFGELQDWGGHTYYSPSSQKEGFEDIGGHACQAGRQPQFLLNAGLACSIFTVP